MVKTTVVQRSDIARQATAHAADLRREVQEIHAEMDEEVGRADPCA